MLNRARPAYLITFHTTADAMAMEKLCREEKLPGRLIPVPRKVTSDCGIAWSAPPEVRGEVDALIDRRGLEVAGRYELEL